MDHEDCDKCKYPDKMRMKGSGDGIQVIGCAEPVTHKEVEKPEMKYCKNHAEIISQDNITLEVI